MKTSTPLKDSIVSGLLWKLLERGGMQLVQFVIQIVLARLLDPKDYGILAIVTVFITFATTLVNNGLCNAIIQKQNSDELDFNTVFYLQFSVAAVCYAVLFFTAPFIADFYENNELLIYIRIMALILFIEACSAMQLTALKKKLEFRKSFFANIAGVVIQGMVGIFLALQSFGIWSLILSQIAMKLTIFIVLLFMVKWHPKRMFSINRFKHLFSYSWKLTVAWMIGTLHQQVYSLVIGKCFSTETLGYYNRGQNIPTTITTIANETISSVMFPALAKVQDDKNELKAYTRLMMKFAAFVVFPLMAGLAAVSENFVYVVLTEKWAQSIHMMQLFCISYGINIISTTNMQAFNAYGRSDIFLKLEVVKRSLSLVLLFIAAQFDIYLVIIVLAAMGIFSLLYNTIPNRKILEYNVKEQLIDLLPAFIASILMFIVTLCVNFIPLPRSALLLLQVLIGVVTYLGFSLLVNRLNTLKFIKMGVKIIIKR